MANYHPNNKGRAQGGGDRGRTFHWYAAPTIGRILTGVFIQPLTGHVRTVEIVRYQGTEVWKARFRETQTILTRLGLQAEFAAENAACADVTDYLKTHGLVMIRQWEAAYPEWSGVSVPPPARRSGLGGLIQ